MAMKSKAFKFSVGVDVFFQHSRGDQQNRAGSEVAAFQKNADPAEEPNKFTQTGGAGSLDPELRTGPKDIDQTSNKQALERSRHFNPADKPDPGLVTVRWRDGVLVSDCPAAPGASVHRSAPRAGGVAPQVRRKIEVIETEARAKG